MEGRKDLGRPRLPINRGTLCAKGVGINEASISLRESLHPMRRLDDKESRRWQRTSWDEAMDLLSKKITEYKDQFGLESIAVDYGTERENEAVIYRFANLLGTPNVLTASGFRYCPRVATGIVTCGSVPMADYDNPPACIMVWGNNVVINNPDEYKGERFSEVLDHEAVLIAVDPRLTRVAARANIWLRPRPGTDVALASGMAHVIVREGLYEREFVETYI